MISGPILIDTNVLLLLIAGATNRSIVNAHKNINNQFNQDDFDLLVDTIGEQPQLILLPNVLTETSNLLTQIKEPYRKQLLRTLAGAVSSNAELYIRSTVAIRHVDFLRLGLTDCALLSADDAQFHLLTVDFDLYHSFLRAGRPVTNFRHVIDRS